MKKELLMKVIFIGLVLLNPNAQAMAIEFKGGRYLIKALKISWHIIQLSCGTLDVIGLVIKWLHRDPMSAQDYLIHSVMLPTLFVCGGEGLYKEVASLSEVQSLTQKDDRKNRERLL